MQFNRKTLFYLSLFTLFGFSLIGLTAINLFQNKSTFQFFREGGTWYSQIFKGFLFGVNASVIAVLLVRTSWFKESRGFFTELIEKINPTYVHVIFYSFCAGVGEEILFRGAIQPHLGIWLTSVLFIFLHGYLNPFNMAITIYGIFMVIISAGLGYLYELFGIYSAMFAHFIFDVAMFSYLKWNARNTPQEDMMDN